MRALAPAAVPVAIAAFAYALEETVLPREVSGVTVAIVLGLVAGNTIRPRGWAVDALARRLLPVAIVLVGLRLSVGEVVDVGPEAVGLAVLAIATGIGTGLALGRALGVGTRLAALIAIGTGICGNTAIVGAAPILRARRDEVAYAVATITLFGTVAVLAFPPIGHLFEVGNTSFGLWMGAGVHDTSQVVAAGFAYSDAAGDTATIVKLARNLFLAPVLAGLALVVSRRDAAAGRGIGLPWFVWGFVGTVALASLVDLPAGVVDWATHAAHALILVAIAAIGATTNLRAMRAVGFRPFALGLGTMGAVTGLVLLAVWGITIW